MTMFGRRGWAAAEAMAAAAITVNMPTARGLLIDLLRWTHLLSIARVERCSTVPIAHPFPVRFSNLHFIPRALRAVATTNTRGSNLTPSSIC